MSDCHFLMYSLYSLPPSRMVMEFYYNTNTKIIWNKTRIEGCILCRRFSLLLMHFWSPQSNLFSMDKTCSPANDFFVYLDLWLNVVIDDCIRCNFLCVGTWTDTFYGSSNTCLYKICKIGTYCPPLPISCGIFFFFSNNQKCQNKVNYTLNLC